MFHHNNQISSKNVGRLRSRFVIGIDEAGRGPLAGPVVVAGVSVNAKLKMQNENLFVDIKDSKKLSVKQRERWFRLLTAQPEIKWAVARVWPRVIDRINISSAANLGALRVYHKLSSENHGAFHALLDGGLKLPPHVTHRAIVKGDERIPIIAAASIIAKVTRDRTMVRLHKKYPQYRFDIHKGYGTVLHRATLKKIGYSEAHRKTFLLH